MRGVFPLHYTIHLQFQDGLLLRRYLITAVSADIARFFIRTCPKVYQIYYNTVFILIQLLFLDFV
jgi:hypothetical protein